MHTRWHGSSGIKIMDANLRLIARVLKVLKVPPTYSMHATCLLPMQALDAPPCDLFACSSSLNLTAIASSGGRSAGASSYSAAPAHTNTGGSSGEAALGGSAAPSNVNSFYTAPAAGAAAEPAGHAGDSISHIMDANASNNSTATDDSPTCAALNPCATPNTCTTPNNTVGRPAGACQPRVAGGCSSSNCPAVLGELLPSEGRPTTVSSREQ